MSTDVLTFGVNHHSAPVDIRERVSMAGDVVLPALHGLRSIFGNSVKEAAILSTCNRTEIYCAADQSIAADIPAWLAEFNSLKDDELRPYIYQLDQDKAVRHAFRVASGLDSMVLGEAQILGQLKTAVRTADEAGTLGSTLHQLFQRTFSVAKEVRTNTAIGAQSISFAAAAVRLSERVFGDLKNSDVLFIGAGEMIELCAAHFSGANPRSITVANRTPERGQLLASRFNGGTMKLSELPEQLHKFDVVVTCTASTLPILGLGMVQKLSRKRRSKPVVMVDLAVPRDVEPEVAQLDNIYLYTVDDLGRYVQMGQDSRQRAVGQAEAIIDARVLNFMQWMESRRLVVPVIQDLNHHAESLRQAELAKARRLLARGEDPEAVLEYLARNLTQKYLHAPMSQLNRSEGVQRQELLNIVPQLFPFDSEQH
ncbi:Glutamyl-tRNA reductase [Oligella urethralis]|uniref:glutamyl-tRNA reductase n=1 Tax=Oligella TaxID=90243 RepID=UPI000477EB31|nr:MULTISPECIES: glutamyl-tRNA reductase [Oligella]AVL71700.1 glutamyl-tRNA reductase [Oligella urethralis]OFV46463.1 glutamyl-tRNA reductase [Oligella sp. HMSC09E12]PMC17315.1 glutamyl-tRNA reductase [Oligella urethralis]WOS38400.1 Glutamyl-tRNA reductase [Oligella urethralis]SUA64551.1 Glutamyl-tRNA reductase [Oligella urethralis]